jgi:hypothetical protein
MGVWVRMSCIPCSSGFPARDHDLAPLAPGRGEWLGVRGEGPLESTRATGQCRTTHHAPRTTRSTTSRDREGAGARRVGHNGRAKLLLSRSTVEHSGAPRKAWFNTPPSSPLRLSVKIRVHPWQKNPWQKKVARQLPSRLRVRPCDAGHVKHDQRSEPFFAGVGSHFPAPRATS